jgi:hypothetical protein
MIYSAEVAMVKENGRSDNALARREALKVLAASAASLGAAAFLPSSWQKPVLQSGYLPAHAQSTFCLVGIGIEQQGVCAENGQCEYLYLVEIGYSPQDWEVVDAWVTGCGFTQDSKYELHPPGHVTIYYNLSPVDCTQVLFHLEFSNGCQASVPLNNPTIPPYPSPED